jgi:RNA polymerase sigma factor (sigma-70 family)
MQDSQLLEDYLTRRSESAFQSLVARYLNLVRSTALRQVRNTSLAEEVAQAVFILLARKAADLRKRKNLALGGWLYRTTRFVAARALRGEQRRRRREQEAFQMQQFSSADETWRRISPMLDEGIEELGQTDRDAVILRFFQDEPLHAVGAALGMSEEAARKRVSRSLDKLRAYFVRRGFTISTAVLAAALAGSRAEAAPAGLAAVVGAKALAHAAATSATLPALAAETLMTWHWASLKILAGFAVTATAVVFLAAHTWTSPVRPPGDSPAAKLASKLTPIPNQTVAATPTTPDKPRRFSFQAVDAETGKGIPKARIVVASAKDQMQMLTRPRTLDLQTNLQTDAQGRCEIELPYLNPLMVMVGVSADGYEERTACGELAHPLPDGYVLKVPRGFSIGGVVCDECGQPVAAATIGVSFDGTSGASNREFQREHFGLRNIAATTDSAGRWTFANCSSNREFRIVVSHPDFPIAVFENDDGTGAAFAADTLKMDDLRAEKAVLVLKAGLTLRGEVTDEHGYRVAGAMLSARDGHSVLAESDGSFVLPAMSPGKNMVTVTANGFAPQRIPVLMASNTAPLAIQLKPAAVLRLRVLDEAGSPLSDARVELARWQQDTSLQWLALTDSDGRAVWGSAPLDRITLTVRKEGYCVLSDNITLIADGQEHLVPMGRPLTLVGRVTDAETKAPISTFKVSRGSDVADGTNGQFELKITEYYHQILVLIEAAGYEPTLSPAMDASATPLACSIEMKRMEGTGPIDGVVTLPDGSAIGGVQVAFAYEGRTVALGRASFASPDDERATETDGEGHFHFAFAYAVRALVAVNRRGFASVLLTPTNHSVALQLQPWGRIEGVLRLKSRSNAGQEIMLSDVRKPDPGQTISLSYSAYTTKTDRQGNFAFNQVPPGYLNLCLSEILGRSESHQTPVLIQPGATTVVQIGDTGDVP